MVVELPPQDEEALSEEELYLITKVGQLYLASNIAINLIF